MKQISLRLPDDLHDQVKAAAEHDERSLHAEILWALRQWLRHHGSDDGE